MTHSKAVEDVLAERRRQIEAEGWSFEHDDLHDRRELLKAARSYADFACYTPRLRHAVLKIGTPPAGWPWDERWWKPTTPRRDLVKAAALIMAEIERMDRAAEKGAA
ncbi:hypothetical protein [Paracoccus onubensis]|uniref:Uncharacterized protein n=1 Tax=Paracoccus onubensis TaxID=1675788 RepID=A0A418T476_9RHOB|nr:hypothetical protein [Paracoccus onubensis]RJE87986.1 hypothetical protein D3P04_03430 [Paracoccus onubensis]